MIKSLFNIVISAGSQFPPLCLDTWLKSQGTGKTRDPTIALIPHDMYVIGTQESALAEKDWINKVKSTLCDDLALSLHTVSEGLGLAWESLFHFSILLFRSRLVYL